MQPHHGTISRPTGVVNQGQGRLTRKPPERIGRFPRLGLFLIWVFLVACLSQSSGHGRERGTSITRNVAWNDLLHQLDLEANQVPHETVVQELVVIQKFLKDHQPEVRVEVYDITVFNAIDQARARLQRADKDLEAIRNALSYKEYQASNRR